MSFYTRPWVEWWNQDRSYGDSPYYNCTMQACTRSNIVHNPTNYNGEWVLSAYFQFVGGYSEFIGGYSHVGLWESDQPPNWNDRAFPSYWGLNHGDLLYQYAPFRSGQTWDTISVSVNAGTNFAAGDATPNYVAVGVDGSNHWLQWDNSGYTLLHSFGPEYGTWEYQHALGRTGRADGVGHITPHMYHGVGQNEIYIFYEKSSGTKYPIHVWKWNGTSWANPVQVQDSALATAGVHYSVKGLIRADSGDAKHVILVLQDGQMIWVDLTNNSSSTTAIATGCAVDEWPECITPPQETGTNKTWGYDRSGGKVTRMAWTNANWKTPTVTNISGCGTPNDTRSYDAGQGTVQTAWTWAYNPATSEALAICLRYGVAESKYIMSASSLDLTAASPTWSAFYVAAHLNRIVDTKNYPAYLGTRGLRAGMDWTSGDTLVLALLSIAADSGTLNNYEQRFVIKWFAQGPEFYVKPDNPLELGDPPTITAGAVVDQGGATYITGHAPVITITPLVEEGWFWDAYYTFQASTGNIVSSGEILITGHQPVITVTPDDDNIRVGVYIAATPTISVTGETFQVLVARLNQQVVYWDLDFTEDVMDLINAYRAGLSLQPYKLPTLSIAQTKTDVSVLLANDMARLGVVQYENAGYTAGNTTNAERTTTAGASTLGQYITIVPLALDYTAIGDTDTNNTYSIINQYTHLTAAEYYANALQYAEPVLSASFAGHTEVYCWLAFAYAYNSNYSTHKHVQYIALIIADYTGGGGGGGDETTPFTDTLKLTVQYPYHGTSWLESFIDLVNVQRNALALIPYRYPVLTDYLNHLDVAQGLAEIQGELGEWGHDNVNYPTGWQTEPERASLANSSAYMAENLLISPMLASQGWFIGFLTPEQAFNAWWNSPTHRANLMSRHQDRQITLYMGFGYGLPSVEVPTADKAWYFVNNFLSIEETVVETYLNVTATFNGALIEILKPSYALYTYTNVRAAHATSWSLRMTVTHEADYGCRVSAAHEAVLMYGVTQTNTGSYGMTYPVRAASDAVYRLWGTYPVVETHTGLYGWRVLGSNEAQYEMVGVVRAAHEAQFSMAMPRAKAAVAGTYSLVARVLGSNTGMYDFTTNVRNGHGAQWHIMAVEPVLAGNETFYSIQDSTAISISGSEATLTVGARVIRIMDAVVSSSEGGMVWDAKMRLADVADYVNINDQDAVTLTIGGEAYTLIVIGKSISRDGPASVDVQVSAKSPLVLQTSPYKPSTYSYSWMVPKMASEMVTEMIGAVDWQCVDWQVPAQRARYEDTTPLAAAQNLLAVAGCILQSNKDGTVVARSLFPTPTDKYHLVVVDHTFTDDADTLSVSEDYEAKEGYNLFRIREGESAFADRMEWVADEEGAYDRGIVRVYPSPWRTTFTCYVLDTLTSLTPSGVVEREEEQVVQFTNGSANVSYPLMSIVSLDWHSAPLASLSFEAGSTLLSATQDVNQGWGLVTIKYMTRAFEYQAQGVIGEKSLMLMEDTGG